MKVLVTGSAGKLGAAVINKLRLAGMQAIGADLVASPTTDLIADIKNKSQADEACQGIDAIIHTAAIHGKHYDLNYRREEFIDTTFSLESPETIRSKAGN